MPNVLLHNPADSGSYTADWSDALPTGVVISDVEHILPSGITLVSETNDNTTTTVRVSGGTHGRQYSVLSKITLDNGEVLNRPLVLTVFNG